MKHNRLASRVSADLALLRFPAPAVDAVRACCFHCSSPLALHQPDPDSPERLLGVCEHCKHWFLIDLLAGLSEGVMVRLPETEVIRELSHEDPPAGISVPIRERDPGSTPPGTAGRVARGGARVSAGQATKTRRPPKDP